MASDRSFGATNAPDTCLWCGTTLRPHYQTRTETVSKIPKQSPCCKAPLYKDPSGPHYCTECDHYVNTHSNRIVSRTKLNRPKGALMDGLFCSLGCAHKFALVLAGNGRRLKPREESEPK